MARPPIAQERLSVDGDGLIVYQLKRPFTDGTTHVSRSRAFMRFAALVHPCTACSNRTTSPLLRRHAPAALVRPCMSSRVCPRWCRARAPISSATTACLLPMHTDVPVARLKRVFEIDFSVCP